MERDQAIAAQNMQMQGQQTQMAAQEAAKVEIEKNQAKAQSEENLERTKNSLKIKFLNQEAIVKKELMMLEFELNTKIKSQEQEIASRMESTREDRKDERVDRQAVHQSRMVEQRKSGDSVKGFESSGNDIITGGSGGLGQFGPR